MDRLLVNADANESDLLLNQRWYVSVSRAREEAVIFTNSADQLRAALDRSVNKEMLLKRYDRIAPETHCLAKNGNAS
jgi:hypothetical protein